MIKNRMKLEKMWKKFGHYMRKPIKAIGTFSLCGLAQSRHERNELSPPKKGFFRRKNRVSVLQDTDLVSFPKRTFTPGLFHTEKLKETTLLSLSNDQDVGKSIDSGYMHGVIQPENGDAFSELQFYPPFDQNLFRCGSIKSGFLFGSSENIALSPEDRVCTDFFEPYSSYGNDSEEGEDGNEDVGTPQEDATQQADITPKDEQTEAEMNALPEDTSSHQESQSCEKQSFQDQTTVEYDCIVREEYISKDKDNNQTKLPQKVNISVSEEENALDQHENVVDTAEDKTVSDVFKEGNEDVFQEALFSDVAEEESSPTTAKEANVTPTFKNENVHAAAQTGYSHHTMDIEKALDTAECKTALMENANTTLKEDGQDVMQYNEDKGRNARTTSSEQTEIKTVKTGTVEYPPSSVQNENAPDNSQLLSDTETMLKVKIFPRNVGKSPSDASYTRDQIQYMEDRFKKESKLTEMPITNIPSGFISDLDKGTQKIRDINSAEWKAPKQIPDRFEENLCLLASRNEMLDNEGRRTGIYVPSHLNNNHSSVNCKNDTWNKECNSHERTDHKMDTPMDSLNRELNEFGEGMRSTFPDGEVETWEGSISDDGTREMTVVIGLKKSVQPLPNKQDKTEHGDLDVNRSKMGYRRDVAETKPLTCRLEMPKTLYKILPLCIFLTRNGAEAAQTDHLLHDNADPNINQILQAFVDIFGGYAPTMAFVVGLYRFARRQGRPICRLLRNLFENRGNIPPAGLLVLVNNARPIQPVGLGVVARALPPQGDGIRVLQPERRANRAVRVYIPRNPVGDTRILRVLEPRTQHVPIQVTEETDQALGPSETVLSGR